MNKKEFLERLNKIERDEEFADNLSFLIEDMGNCYAAGYLKCEIEAFTDNVDDSEELFEFVNDCSNYNIWKE